MKLSVLIITFNEEKHIEQCIRSVKKLSDEIIVVDSFSTDKTQEICKRLEVKLYLKEYEGQIEQKNFALSKAQYDHVLALDADEMLTDELSAEILSEKAQGFPSDGYSFRRKNNYAGHWIRYGGWGTQWKLRLWQKDKAIWAGSNPHDKVVLRNPHNHKMLSGYFLHFAFKSIAEHRERIETYANLGAQSLFERGEKTSPILIILSPAFKFLKDYFFRLGFLDGRMGWEIALLSAKSRYLKYRTLQKLIKDHK
ncbi:MAG: glycosyltransferase family 2 protein [Marinoscillum sp.]